MRPQYIHFLQPYTFLGEGSVLTFFLAFTFLGEVLGLVRTKCTFLEHLYSW